MGVSDDNKRTSENFCDRPWKLLGQVSTVGCSDLHKWNESVHCVFIVVMCYIWCFSPIWIRSGHIHWVLLLTCRFTSFYKNRSAFHYNIYVLLGSVTKVEAYLVKRLSHEKIGLPGFAVRISQITKRHNKDACSILIQLTTMMRSFSSRRTWHCCLQVLELTDNRITCNQTIPESWRPCC